MVLLATVLFILSVLVIAGMFLVKLSYVNGRSQIRIKISDPSARYYETFLPYFKKKLRFVVNKIWHFILEAKDLTPATTKTIHTKVEKVKNAFRIRIRSSDTEPAWLPEAAELTIKSTISQNPEDLYLEAIKKDPTNQHAYEGLSRLYLQNKNYAEAIEIYEYLIKLDPTKDIYLSNLGLAYYSNGDYQKAVAAYEKALNINNKVGTRWINLALCFQALEEYAKAVKALTHALDLDNMNINYLSLLAEFYLKLDNSVRAEEVFERILAIDPTNKPAREKLMRLKI